MTDLQKDQAIYKAMYEIAQNIVSNAAEHCEFLRNYMKERGNSLNLKDITKRYSDPYNWIFVQTPFNPVTKEGLQAITVDTFSCEFQPMQVFGLLNTWKTLAKVKGDIIFTYEEKVTNEFIGAVDIDFDDPVGAKTLATCTIDDIDTEMRPILRSVLVEVNVTTRDINFVCTDGRTLSVVSSNRQSIAKRPSKDDNVLQALFSKADWKRICDYAAKNGSVKFELYKRGENEHQDTMVAILGDSKAKSFQEEVPYPKWHDVIQTKANKHFRIHHSHVKAAQKFIKSFKSAYDKERDVCVSFYRGSEYVYFDYKDLDFSIDKTAKFLLESPSDETCGINLKIGRLQRMKFSGFHIEDGTRAAVIDCEGVDFMMLMPAFNDGCEFTHDVEEREALAAQVA